MNGNITLPAIAVVALGLILIGTLYSFIGGLVGVKGLGDPFSLVGWLIVALIVVLFVLVSLVRRE